MNPLPTVNLELAAIVAFVAALCAGAFYLWRWDRRRRMRQAPARTDASLEFVSA